MSGNTTKEKIIHRRAHDFKSLYANGTVMSFMPSTGCFNITFCEDVVGVIAQTQETDESGETRVIFEDGDLEVHKEDKVRITMPESDLKSFYALLKRRFESGGGADENG